MERLPILAARAFFEPGECVVAWKVGLIYRKRWWARPRVENPLMEVWAATAAILAVTFVVLMCVMGYKLYGEKGQESRFLAQLGGRKK